MTDRLNLNLIDYLRHREAQERAAAKNAVSLHARRIHQELAQLHARASLSFTESRD